MARCRNREDGSLQMQCRCCCLLLCLFVCNWSLSRSFWKLRKAQLITPFLLGRFPSSRGFLTCQVHAATKGKCNWQLLAPQKVKMERAELCFDRKELFRSGMTQRLTTPSSPRRVAPACPQKLGQAPGLGFRTVDEPTVILPSCTHFRQHKK